MKQSLIKNSKKIFNRCIDDILYNSPHLIRYLSFPTEHEQLISVKQDGFNIMHIKNPSLPVQKAAILNNVKSVKHILNPCKEIQYLVLDINVLYLQYIEYIEEEVQIKTISSNPKNIAFIKNPTPKVQKIILNKYPELLERINKIDSSIQLDLVKSDYTYINKIKNPSYKVILYLLDNKLNGYISRKFNLDDVAQNNIIEKYPLASTLFEKPNKEARKILLLNKLIDLEAIHEPSSEEINYSFIGKNIIT